ncbi:MAG: Rieske (2Fe-2S) protein [Solirubrobacteraceae bacterium]
MTPGDAAPTRRLAKALGVLVALRTAWRAVARRPQEGQPLPPMPPESEHDPSRRTVPSSPRAERVVAGLLLAAALCGFGFTAIYVVHPGNETQWLGLALGLTLAWLAAACIVAGKLVVPQETSVEERGQLLQEEAVEQAVEQVESGAEGVSRRGLLIGAGGVAGAGLVVALATPVASLGPSLSDIHDTPWHRGRRMVDEKGVPYLASEIELGSFYTALPEHADQENFGSGLLVIKLPQQYIHLPADRRDWAPQGILAFSKICPHAGCAISEYRYPLYPNGPQQQPAFTCPCHYSTFLPGRGGELIYGPAGRELPQLPVMIDSQGYLAAGGPFREDVGPSWWNVHRSND